MISSKMYLQDNALQKVRREGFEPPCIQMILEPQPLRYRQKKERGGSPLTERQTSTRSRLLVTPQCFLASIGFKLGWAMSPKPRVITPEGACSIWSQAKHG